MVISSRFEPLLKDNFIILSKIVYKLNISWCYLNTLLLELPEACFDYLKHEFILIFSSPELKAQVSFSGHILSVIYLSVPLSVNFQNF